MMKPLVLAAVAAATGCSHQVYSPPSQAYALDAIRALQPGQRAIDVEVARHAQIFDPDVVSGTGRYHTGLGDDTEVSAEASTLAVGGEQTPGQSHNIYMGRTGVRSNPSRGPFSVFGGLGGGYAPAGGGFVAIDGGLAVGFDNCVLVPVFQASVFGSQPIDPKQVNTGSDGSTTFTDTAQRTVGAVLRGGLRLSLSPSACRRGEQAPWFTLGMDVTSMLDASSDAEMMGLGMGLQLPL